MRRRPDDQIDGDGVPGWLPVFVLEDWRDPADPPPADWGLGTELWYRIRADERWADAGRSWLADRGRRGEWWPLTRPQVVSR